MLFPTLVTSVSSLLIITVNLAGDFLVEMPSHHVENIYHVRIAKSTTLWWCQLTVNVTLGDESTIFIETALLSFPLYSSGRNCRNPPLLVHGTLKHIPLEALIIDDPFTNIVVSLYFQPQYRYINAFR